MTISKNELEKYLGKIVEITIIDGDKYTGELHKTGEEQFKCDPSLYIPKNYYFVTDPSMPIFCCCKSCLFRCSHVRKIKNRLPCGNRDRQQENNTNIK